MCVRCHMVHILHVTWFVAGRVPVPDERYDYLCKYYKPLRCVNMTAVVHFNVCYNQPNLVTGAMTGIHKPILSLYGWIQA